MNKMLLQYIMKQAETKNIAVWGTGKLSVKAEEILEQLDIKDYVYIDSALEKQNKLYKGKKVIAPNIISKNYFILVSTASFPEISVDLYMRGYKDLEDYVSALELDYYEALLENIESPRVPEVSINILNNLENQLRENVTCEDITWFDENEFIKYEQELNFEESYKKGYNLIWETKPYSRYRRKIMEYYIVDKIMDFNKWDSKDVYLDLGAQTSPFAKYLRENRKIEAFGIDLEQSIYADFGYYLQEDATNMHFEDNSVKGISMQSAFECFSGDSDISLIKEVARVLEPGGKFVIAPLYMHEKYISTVSPTHYNKEASDLGSFECIRTDCRGGKVFGRFYDYQALKSRVLDTAKEQGLKIKIHILPNNLVECDSFVYLKFILVLEK